MQKRAFSLLELVLVITIMGIMAGAIMPSVSNSLKGRRLGDYCDTLSNMLRYARSLAVERSMITKISFDEESANPVLSVEADPLNAPGTFEDERFPIFISRDFGSDITIASIVKNALEGTQVENEITFNPDGSTSDTFIYVTDDNERIHTVGIIGLTGQIMVWKQMMDNFYGNPNSQQSPVQPPQE